MKQESRMAEFFHRYLPYIIPSVLLIGLGALLMPVYSSGGSSPGSNCISNLKQLGSATAIYASDNDDAIPIDYSFEI